MKDTDDGFIADSIATCGNRLLSILIELQQRMRLPPQLIYNLPCAFQSYISWHATLPVSNKRSKVLRGFDSSDVDHGPPKIEHS